MNIIYNYNHMCQDNFKQKNKKKRKKRKDSALFHSGGEGAAGLLKIFQPIPA